jgi:hypothetical protein
MSALSKVEMSVSAPFWEFGGCYFDGHGDDEGVCQLADQMLDSFAAGRCTIANPSKPILVTNGAHLSNTS